jgi:hypothetical protein
MEPAVLSFQNWNWWVNKLKYPPNTDLNLFWVGNVPTNMALKKTFIYVKAQWPCACFILSNIRPSGHGYIVSF